MHDGGRAKDALAMLTDLAQSDPTNFDAQMGIGAAAKLAGNYQLAFEAFRRTGKAQFAQCVGVCQPGAHGAATITRRRRYRGILQMRRFSADNAGALRNLAIASTAKGTEKEAQAAFQRTLQLQQSALK
jgi:tetratricopeptide (TPR) repeat protein